MTCPYECHQVGGPWIAENPSCPTHGWQGQQSLRDYEEKMKAIHEILCRCWLRDISADEALEEIEILI